MLYQAALKLAHQKPQLRVELLPAIRKEKKRLLLASGGHQIAAQAVTLLKTNLAFRKSVQQDLLGAGVPKDLVQKVVTLENPFQEHEFIKAVETGLAKNSGLVSGVMNSFGKFLGAIVRLVSSFLHTVVGRAFSLVCKIAIFLAISIISPRFGVRQIVFFLVSKIVGTVSRIINYFKQRKFEKQNEKELAEERAGRLKTKRRPGPKIDLELEPADGL